MALSSTTSTEMEGKTFSNAGSFDLSEPLFELMVFVKEGRISALDVLTCGAGEGTKQFQHRLAYLY